MAAKALIHSVETCGALDGPGLRYVLFLRGCPFRCIFCHNPDTWTLSGATQKTASEVLEDILKYADFFRFSGGGVTLSGGEPLLQADFAAELFGLLRARGISTALDTCGYVDITDSVAECLRLTDLVMLDIKHLDRARHFEITGKPCDKVMRFLNYACENGNTVRIRIVVVPSLTDSPVYFEALAKYLTHYKNSIELVELLPYHDMGKAKWHALGLEYKLEDTPAPAEETLAKAEEIFGRYGFGTLRTKR